MRVVVSWSRSRGLAVVMTDLSLPQYLFDSLLSFAPLRVRRISIRRVFVALSPSAIWRARGAVVEADGVLVWVRRTAPREWRSARQSLAQLQEEVHSTALPPMKGVCRAPLHGSMATLTCALREQSDGARGAGGGLTVTDIAL